MNRFLPVATRRLILAIAGIVSVSFPQQVFAQSVEAKVKTAYIYSLLRGSTWPPETHTDEHSPYKVVIVGADDLGGLLDKVVEKKSIQQRKIVLERIGDMHSFHGAHLLYLPGAKREAVAAAAKATAGQPILIVGEGANVTACGAAIGFFMDDAGTLAVEVNPTAARARNLEIDDKVMTIGKKVGD
ncbi:YfiR family protein [Blastopirellula sp. JC732]|uniref:YfiR family protein n=1 Tax=Blastopirellula sediminis TaxID=2894196 RepID=A0A9X1SFW2_9BACT|nr:YfiR family protein [Blastopirellula sediminis]MCC9608981.1 YfiR family protein [Blastopirellula sediminis]MCC9628242.1 YfiR family protein [Blastopirellula sediminis]